MKFFIAILMLLLSLSGFAGVGTFNYDGSQSSTQMNLSSEEWHTEYRYETRRTICYRQEVHYRTICRPLPNGGHSCTNYPEYRTVSYPCTQTVRVAYQVKDYDVDANVIINVKRSSDVNADENFRVSLQGNDLSLSASGSRNYLIILKDKKVSTSISGSVKFIDAIYTVELVDAFQVVNALNLTNISLKDSVLNFNMGPVEARQFVGFKIEVKKAPVIGSSTVLFNRELSPSEVELSAEGEGTLGTVLLNKLGVKIGSGRHTVSVNTFFKIKGSILNSSQFEKLESVRTLIIK
jgi:hypothetical protein